MYKVYFKNKLIFETDNVGNIREKVKEYSNKIKKEINPYIEKIENIERLLKNNNLENNKISNNDYIKYLKENSPELIEILEDLAKEISGENFIELNITDLNTTDIGWLYTTIENNRNIKTLNNLKLELTYEIPTPYNIKITNN